MILMAAIRKLVAKQIDVLGPGKHSDGRNLYLHVRDGQGGDKVYHGNAGDLPGEAV